MLGNLNRESFMALGSFPGVKIIIMKVMHIACVVVGYRNYNPSCCDMPGSFLAGEMTGVGVYQLSDGGLFDAAAGLYYPDGANRENFHEAHFDGHTLRYKKAKPAGNLQQGYN